MVKSGNRYTDQNKHELIQDLKENKYQIYCWDTDQQAILKTASGFLKLLYPNLELTLQDYQRDCLEPAKELRQHIRNLLYNLDDEFKQYEKDIYVDVK